MSLTSVIASKEGNYQPALLAVFTFADGSTLRASTHNLNAAEGGNQYQSNDYLARISEEDISQIQARSEQGIDRISDVTIHLFNADQVILNNYEMAAGKGFKGAILKLVLVLMDIDPTTGNYLFSTDSPAPVKFQGICDPGQAESGGSMVTVRANTSHNMGRVDFPILHIQPRCINVFPRNAAERLLGGTDMSSWWWGCGYDPDQAGTDPEIGGDCRRGNTTSAGATDAQGRVIADSGGRFISCNYTKADCVARGMYSKDSTSRRTGRFTAIQWSPPWREGFQKSYASGKTVAVFAGLIESIYQRSYPMLYGTQWVKRPVVVAPIGDGNATRFEVVVCLGDVGYSGIQQVVVNGVIVPRNFGPGSTDPLFRWNFVGDTALNTAVHTGGRNGQATLDAGFAATFNSVTRTGTPLGDPYGSLAAIEVVCYAELVQSNSQPDVRILSSGPKVKIPNTANAANQATWPYATTTLPPWHLLDLLIWGNYSYSEIDLQSFIDEATYCGTAVSYVDLNGATQSHDRFISEFVLEERRKGNETIQALLRSFNAQLIPNANGLLGLFIRKTLADQQPAPVSGSNYNTSVLSIHADGTAGSGYVAYLIDESIIQLDDSGQPKIRGPYCLPNSQAANRISFGFQDRDNHWADDSISVVDADDVARAAGYQLGGQTVDAGISMLGISNFDQGIRVSNTILAENLRGNEQGDTRGTRFWDIESTHRLEHLKAGQIVLFRYQANALQPLVSLQSPSGTNITGILCRVEKITPTTNYRRMTVTLRWHECLWYTDAYGQHAAPLFSDPAKSLPARPPYPWKPFAEQPITGDSIWAASEWNFAIAQSYTAAADGSAVATLSVKGNPPLNQPSPDLQPPLTAIQGGTANTGGTIAGGQRLYGAIAAQDAAGKWSLPSKPFVVDIPSGTNTNTLVTPTIRWQSGTINWAFFVGRDEQQWTMQSTGSGTPSTITITAMNVAVYGPPDQLADGIQIRVKRVYHGGVWGDTCSAVTSNGDGTGTIVFGTATTTHQFQEVDATHGYDLTKLANVIGSELALPIADFHVIDNTGGTYTVSPDPVAAGIVAGDVFEMQALPTVMTATTLGCSAFVNAYGVSGLTVNAEANRRVRIIAGTGRGQQRTIVSNTSTTLTIDSPWDVVPDNTSRFVIEESTWQDAPISRQSSAVLVSSPAPTVASFSIDNYRTQTVLVQALVVDPNENTSLERFSPIRQIYIWGGQGTRSITTSDTQLVTDGLVLCDTGGISQPAATTLAAAITSTSQTAITLTDGSHTVNGSDILCGTERMRIQAGGGTNNVDVLRGAAGTAAATHLNGAAVTVPGGLVFTCLPSAQVPNVNLVVKKLSADINYVSELAGGSDTFDNGSTVLILPDNTDSDGMSSVLFPG